MGLIEIGTRISSMYHNWHARSTVEKKLVQMLGSGEVTPSQLDFYAGNNPEQESVLSEVVSGLVEALDDPEKMKVIGEKLDQMPNAQKLDIMIRLERDFKGLFFDQNKQK